MSADELRDIFTTVGEKFDEEEMDEFLGWLGLRNGGEISVERFRHLPCWYVSEVHKEAMQSSTEETKKRMPFPHMPKNLPKLKGSRSASMPELPLSLSKVEVTVSESQAPAASAQAPAAASARAAAAAARDWVLSEEELAKYESADC